jgi:prepilin-type N-terminal cleavage/methylation domain-containing protein
MSQSTSRVLRRGFTLIEILIVITIIAILALIIIPKMHIPVDRARTVSMEKNRRIIQRALEVFHSDTGVYPYELTDLTKTTVTDLSAGTCSKTGFVSQSFRGPYLIVQDGGIELLPRNPLIRDTTDDLARHWTYDHDGEVQSAFGASAVGQTPGP